MKLSLPDWFTRKKTTADAPPATVEAELERLAAAKTDIEQQETLVTAARERLTAERSEAASAALRAAKDRLEELRELIPIVEADVEAARARRAADERAALERQIEKLKREIIDADSIYQTLSEEECKAWQTILEIRCARHENRSARESLASEREALGRQLTGEPKPTEHYNTWDVRHHPDERISKFVYELFNRAVPWERSETTRSYIRGRIANFLSEKQVS